MNYDYYFNVVERNSMQCVHLIRVKCVDVNIQYHFTLQKWTQCIYKSVLYQVE